MPIRDQPFRTLRRAGRRPAIWLGLPILLYGWSVTSPFLFDDVHLLLKTERYISGQRPELALFDFGATEQSFRELIDRGTLPWWTSADVGVAFFRPLAEWSFYVDVLLFGRQVVGHRLVSLAWFVLALVCVNRLYRAVDGDSSLAGAATLLFGVSQTLAGPVALICNRSDLLVVVGTAIAARAYWSASGRSDWRKVVAAVAGFAFALLCKEIAVALAGVLVAHQLLIRWRRRVAPQGARVWIAGLLMVMAGVYVVFHASTRPSQLGVFSDWSRLLGFLESVPRSLGLYLAVWTIGFPVNAVSNISASWPAVVVAAGGAGVAAVTVWYLCRSAAGEPGAGFFGLWAVVFLVPTLLTMVEPRALSLATVGWAYLAARLLVPNDGTSSPAPSWLRHWLLTTNGFISICCVIATVAVGVRVEKQARGLLTEYVADLSTPMRDGDTLIVAEARHDFETSFAGDRLEYVTGLSDVSVAFLAVAGADARITREDDHTLRAAARSRLLFGSPAHRVVLGAGFVPQVGRKFRARDFVAEITGVEDGLVTELRFCFDTPLDSGHLHFSDQKGRLAGIGLLH